MTLCLYEAGKEQEFMCYDFSYFAVVYTTASATQYIFTVIVFDSENIPSLSVEVMVSVSYDVLLMQSLYITACYAVQVTYSYISARELYS